MKMLSSHDSGITQFVTINHKLQNKVKLDEVIKYFYSCLCLLTCEVYKWLKISFKKSFLEIAYQQSQKVICFYYVNKKPQNSAGPCFNSLASYTEPFWQDGRHTGEI